MSNRVEKSDNKIKSRGLLASLLLRFVTIISMALVACLLFMIFTGRIKKTFFTEKKEVREAMVSQQLLSVQELVTQKYRYSDIITLKKTLIFSKSYSIVKFSGIIRAGIEDISSADFTISPDRTSLTIRLPHAKILGNEIIDQAVFDEKRSLFVPITTQEVFDEIDAVRASIAREAEDQGLLEEADSGARKTVCQLMYALGFDSVTVEFKNY